MEMLKNQSFIMLRMPKQQEIFVQKLIVHFPLYMDWLVDKEIKEKFQILTG